MIGLVDLGLRLAGAETVVFRCGCVFARGDETGVAAWRLCPAHLNDEYTIGRAFAYDGEACVIVPRPAPERRARGAKRGSVQQLEHALRRARDHRPFAAEDDGALHELGVSEEELDDGVGGRVVARPEPELREALVLSDEVARRIGDGAEDALEPGPADWRLQVLDGVELDAPLAEDRLHATRLTSPRVVIDEQPLHPPRA